MGEQLAGEGHHVRSRERRCIVPPPVGIVVELPQVNPLIHGADVAVKYPASLSAYF